MKRIPATFYDEALKKLVYNPLSPSGLTWHNGRDAGSKDHNGYWLVRIGKKPGKLLKAHRIVWYMFYKTLPDLLDHHDGNTSNNLIGNLREASESQNRHNSKKHSDNTSGHKGVFWDKANQSWMVKCSFQYKSYWGGRFKNLDDAIKKATEMRENFHKEFAKHA